MANSSPIARIQAVVSDDFAAVDQHIHHQLSSDVPLVQTIGNYIVNAGGKRLRPLLVLLSARACGFEGESRIALAAVIEFLHTATLLHDDVVDTSDLRRGRDTANAKWGNAPSVLVGDFLYSRAFEMMVDISDLEVMRILSNATTVIAQGEVLQLMKVRDASTSEATYMDVIRAKTAMLFEASTHAAAVLSGVDKTHQSALQQYGDKLGIAFQLIDDLLDYQGDAQEMGKNVGDDLAEGKPTLPLIYTMREGTPAQSVLVREAIQKGGLDHIDAISEAVRDSGALTYTAKLAQRYADDAIQSLAALPASEARTAMESLAEFSVARSF
ncbi:polyprenyl synthetase family protein [Aestuariirhabdus sp. Z084]|uniref:polyprenyl synthetase family protein n=1 Tax=Aestuariirhabdus haliotis TaxID=2918751 RepID=UPI00201B3C1C|nr:polyprenyl synthetase family protein [Aestuariirhabdus haliotis]MCL6416199.1 polyprenyl synthetase family protein [Aestuariirhabdus haliotis]MCL6420251.1 polyprenyl synthetase family protein [Aestuariirhabdus haliotis]